MRFSVWWCFDCCASSYCTWISLLFNVKSMRKSERWKKTTRGDEEQERLLFNKRMRLKRGGGRRQQKEIEIVETNRAAQLNLTHEFICFYIRAFKSHEIKEGCWQQKETERGGLSGDLATQMNLAIAFSYLHAVVLEEHFNELISIRKLRVLADLITRRSWRRGRRNLCFNIILKSAN